MNIDVTINLHTVLVDLAKIANPNLRVETVGAPYVAVRGTALPDEMNWLANAASAALAGQDWDHEAHEWPETISGEPEHPMQFCVVFCPTEPDLGCAFQASGTREEVTFSFKAPPGTREDVARAFGVRQKIRRYAKMPGPLGGPPRWEEVIELPALADGEGYDD